MERLHSQAEWIERAKAVLPAGGFGNFDPGIVIRDGEGSRVHDEDGKEYIDYLIGSGPMLLGHGHPEVLEAVFEQLPRGMTFFANNAAGIQLAEEICRAVPCAEQVRFVSSGGEADMYAMRLARAVTGRDKILKFEGGYHGMSAEAQMSLAPEKFVNFPNSVPDSGGIPEAIRNEVWAAPFNDIDYLRSFMKEYGHEIAGIIVEPLQRIIPPEDGFLEELRKLCDECGTILIFDEIVTGFRFAYGGAQERYGVVPDICTLGKIIGGGFALAAIAGRTDLMAVFDKSKVDKDSWLMQLGTLSGNPVASAAGLKTLEILRRPGSYEKLRETGKAIMKMLETHLSAAGIEHQIVGDPTLFDVIFSGKKIRDYRDWKAADHATNGIFNKVLRQEGIFKSTGKLYPSLAITEADLSETERAIAVATESLLEGR